MTKSPAAAALDSIVADVHEPGLKVVLMPPPGRRHGHSSG